MPHPTLVISWDQFGLKVEAPTHNGAARVKIEGISFSDLPPTMQAALIEQRDRIARQPAPTLAPSARESRDFETIRRERIEKEKKDREDRWNAALEKMTEKEREFALAQREENIRKAEEYRLLVAKRVWHNVASDHGTELANRVISDPTRRPGKRVIVVTKNGQHEINPRNQAAFELLDVEIKI
jgi:hypothetical protein